MYISFIDTYFYYFVLGIDFFCISHYLIDSLFVVAVKMYRYHTVTYYSPLLKSVFFANAVDFCFIRNNGVYAFDRGSYPHNVADIYTMVACPVSSEVQEEFFVIVQPCS